MGSRGRSAAPAWWKATLASLGEVADERALRRQVESLSIRLAEQAGTDALTGLANRARVYARLERALPLAGPGRGAGVLLIDLDGFKVINDLLGHDTGDDVLRVVGRRLASVVRDGDTVGRLGGDEFVLVQPDADEAGAHALAERVTGCFTEPVAVGSSSIRVRASCGVVVVEPGTSPQEALRRADAAMYAAKRAGGGWRAYDSQLHQAVTDSHRLRADAADAARRGELVLHLQPIVELRTGATVGAEALVRWQHPDLGLLAPGRFIELAEQSGAIVDMGHWVFEAALQQLLALDAAGHPLYVSVNVSPRQLASEAAVDGLLHAVATAGVEPARVSVEITETALMADTPLMIDRLERLRRAGLRVAMDDFGTGYSSLALLRQLPVDVLKIDRSFVDGVDTEPARWALLAAVHQLATSLGKEPLAEGVETGGQLAHLRAVGVEYAQGYLFARPMPAKEFLDWLAATAAARSRPDEPDEPDGRQGGRR